MEEPDEDAKSVPEPPGPDPARGSEGRHRESRPFPGSSGWDGYGKELRRRQSESKKLWRAEVNRE